MMQFQRSFLFLILVYCFHFDSIKCGTDDVEASCDTICNCVEKEYTEFRAICEGNGTEGLILSKNVFQDEKIPKWNRKVYVRVSNFTEANIKENFLSKWLSYATCSLDIWDAPKVIFPQKVPPIAKTKAVNFIFAGIGFYGSSIQEFPNDLFKGKKTFGLKFANSSVNHLNLFKLGGKAINYFDVKDSLIKVLDGNPSESLTLVSDRLRGDAKVEIQDSKIGYVSENALSFNDYESGTEASITIKGSTIGILGKSAIKIGTSTSLEIQGSTLSDVLPSAFHFVDGRNSLSSITGNLIGVEDDSMKQLKCDSSLQIQDNLIYTKEVLTDCILDGYEAETSPSCDKSLEMSNYLDTSCENNHIVGKYYPPLQPTEPSTTTTSTLKTTITTTPVPSTTTSSTIHPSATTTASAITTPVPTTTISTTTTPCLLTIMPSSSEYNVTSNNNTSEIDNSGSASGFMGGSKFSLSLLYLLAGLCLCLLIVVIILTAVLIWGKKYQTEPDDLKGKPDKQSCMVKDNEMYFFPNPERPMSESFIRKTDEDVKTDPLVLNETKDFV